MIGAEFILMGRRGLTWDKWCPEQANHWYLIKLIIFKYLLHIYLVGMGQADFLLLKIINKNIFFLYVKNKGFFFYMWFFWTKYS